MAKIYPYLLDLGKWKGVFILKNRFVVLFCKFLKKVYLQMVAYFSQWFLKKYTHEFVEDSWKWSCDCQQETTAICLKKSSNREEIIWLVLLGKVLQYSESSWMQ